MTIKIQTTVQIVPEGEFRFSFALAPAPETNGNAKGVAKSLIRLVPTNSSVLAPGLSASVGATGSIDT